MTSQGIELSQMSLVSQREWRLSRPRWCQRPVLTQCVVWVRPAERLLCPARDDEPTSSILTCECNCLFLQRVEVGSDAFAAQVLEPREGPRRWKATFSGGMFGGQDKAKIRSRVRLPAVDIWGGGLHPKPCACEDPVAMVSVAVTKVLRSSSCRRRWQRGSAGWMDTTSRGDTWTIGRG